MHRGLFTLALLPTLGLAFVTVALNTRATNRMYDLARAERELREVGECCDARWIRVHALWTPERVRLLAQTLRLSRTRRAAAQEAVVARL